MIIIIKREGNMAPFAEDCWEDNMDKMDNVDNGDNGDNVDNVDNVALALV